MFELMKFRCLGNYNLFVRDLWVDPAHLYRFLNTGVGGGKKMLLALMKYCESHNLNFSYYLESD